jgi:hypothetical protein
MSQSDASRHRGAGGGMSPTTLLAAKVAFAAAAAASAARLAAPHAVSAAGAVVPRVWAVARFWLAPPYLFVTVHLIILVIWKLSDHKQHFQAQAHHKDHPWPVAHPPPPAVAVAKEAEFDAYGAGGHVDRDYSSPEFSPDSGGDSCVTTESDEDASSSSYYYYSVEARTTTRSVPPAQERAAVLERESSQTVDDGDDDLDATWNAIMQKTRSARPPPPPPRARDPSVGAEEMNRRFDDFIKKNRHSFGRQ